MSRGQLPAPPTPSWTPNQHPVSNVSSTTIPADYDAADAQRNNSSSYSLGSSAHSSDRQLPTRSSTLGTSSDRGQLQRDTIPHARSEDMNHSTSYMSYASSPVASSQQPSPAFMQSSGSRPSTPSNSGRNVYGSDDLNKRMSVASLSSVHSTASLSSSTDAKPPPSSVSSNAALVSA